jgi:hypothetical protein
MRLSLRMLLPDRRQARRPSECEGLAPTRSTVGFDEWIHVDGRWLVEDRDVTQKKINVH